MKTPLLAAALALAPTFAHAESCLQDRGIQLAGGAYLIAMTADAESTFAAMRHNPNVIEGNPIMRGVIEGGRLPTYAVGLGVGALSIGIACLMRRSSDPVVSGNYLFVPLLFAGGHAVAAGVNVRLFL